jgi:sigma-B regulation protein RsbU (phosphoserine phosphatase)
MRAVSTATPSPRFAAFRTVRGRLLFWVLAVTIPIYAGALYLSSRTTAERLEADAERDARDLAARLAAGLDAVIRPIEGGVRTVAYELEAVDPAPSQYPDRIRGILGAWPEVYGSTIATDGEAGNTDGRPFAPYFYRRANRIAYADLARDSYAYRDLPWYRRAAEAGGPVWSLPYFDAGGGETWMVTYSVPFFRLRPDDRRVIAGVVTADLDLEWVKRVAAKVPLGPIGLGWLSSPQATSTFVAPIGDTVTRLDQFDRSLDQASIREIGEAMLERKASFGRLPRGATSQPAYLAVRDLETLGWRLMLIIPRAELFADARALLYRQLWLGGLGLLALIAAISLVASGIARPVHALAAAVHGARDGDLDFQLPDTPRRDEIGVLTEALRQMRDSLQTHVRLRADSLAAQARLEHELQIAASIQQSMLPRGASGTALPAGALVAAALLPARQVGGDLYDYFTLRDHNVLFAIGDVSDKGVPAALFMARLSGLLRVLGAAGEMPDRLLAGINARLVEGNDACMFVTVGCGILNVQTGQVRYASAGHESPLLREAEGSVRPWNAENGPAIGIDAAVEYELRSGFVAPGDTLVLFTDGVTEAADDHGALFGVERLGDLLAGTQVDDPTTLVQRVVDTVAAHAPGFHATDDLTIMAISWRPPDVTLRREGDVVHWLIAPPVSVAGVLEAQHRLRAILSARDVPLDRIADVELIVEELLANIVRAAEGEPGDTRVELDCALTPNEILLEIRDDGRAFDPLGFESTAFDVDIDERRIGGLGIPLVKQLADACRYSRTNGENVLEIRLHRTSVTT